MANEGSTKPTYSELESCEHDYSLATCKCLKCGHEYDPAYAGTELLRVRGLLQRVTEIANGSQTWIDRVNAIVELLESGNCRLCGKPLSDELHQADKDLLACSTHGEYDYHKFTQADSPTLPQSSSLGSQGAESADIGKEMKIRNEIYRAARLLGAQSDLLCLLGSWGNTLPDEDILDYLKRWNDVTETELEQKAGTE